VDGDVEVVGSLTEDDLIEIAMRESGEGEPLPAVFITVADFAEARGITPNRARDWLLRLVERGVFQGRQATVDGRRRWIFWAGNHV